MATTKKAIAEAEQAAEIKEATAVPTTEPEAPAVTLDELEGMDMNMFDAEETESAPRPVWRITDDGCADWACRKIAEEKTELDRITALGESQIEKIQQRIDAAQRRYENGTRFLTGKLAEYFETVPHKTTKTKHSYRLLSGTLVKKIGGNTMKQDDDDPDMSDHSSEPPQQSQKQHTGTQNGNRQGNTQPQAQNGQTGRSGAARPLSDAQLSRLYRKGEDAGYSQQSINEWILKKYGQQDPHNLTRAQYDEACAAMDNAKQQGGQDNA